MTKGKLRFATMLIASFSVLLSSAPAFAADLQIGAWPGSTPTQSNIQSFQTLGQRKLDFVETYINWSTNFSSVKASADATYSNGSKLLLTWEPWEYDTVKIKNGDADSYIQQMADDIKAYGKEIWMRPLHEANGNWYPWGIGDSKVNTNDSYIAAFRHIVDIFKARGVTNVKWVFCINCSNVGTGASFLGNYPGDNYVDYTAIDGYNWGTTQSWGSTWQSFDQIFSQSYNTLCQIQKPILITEFSSAEQGGNKAQWITETFNTIRSSAYSRIIAAIWFNENKETNWTINSSDTALNAFVKAVAVDTPKGIVGDLSGDGKINSTDYSLLKRFILGQSTSTPDMSVWDLNNDGKLNSTDLSLMKRYILNIITSFPR